MLALVWHARQDVRVEEVADAPAPAADQVQVAVEWCGICGTDAEEYRTGPHQVPLEPHPLTGRSAPLVLGHEVVGIVAEAGAESGFEPGQRVVLDAVMGCGGCWWCRRNQANLCTRMGAIGLQADGGLAERVTVPASMCVLVPDDLASETAVLAEPLAVAIHGVRRAGVTFGASVTVVGAGMVGLSAIHAARAAGASAVLCVEPSETRQRLAIRAGADLVVAPDNVPDALRGLGLPFGTDAAVEAAGRPAAVATALQAIRPGGRAAVVGLSADHLSLDLYELVARERELVGSLSHVVDDDLTLAVELLRKGELTADSVDAVKIPLDRTVEDGFRRIDAPDAPVKVMVNPRS